MKPARRPPGIQHRRHEPLDGLDYFPTPPWATRALVEHIVGARALRRASVWEPACGEGHMAAVLAEYSPKVRSSDVFAYGYGEVCDFLDTTFNGPSTADWIITNPPFNKALEFVELALDRSRLGVAMFVRTGFLQSKGRYRNLFREWPPTVVGLFVERVPILKGRWDPDATTATDTCWLVWMHGQRPRPTFWIPPSRQLLARVDDVARFGPKPADVPAPLFDEAA